MSQQVITGQDAVCTISEMPELDKIYSLIKAMYEQNEYKEFASKWLEELQKSVYAWQISDQLLIKRVNFESCYFAAQTLKTKIQHSFGELPIESYDSLKNSIINHLVNMEEKAIQTQLCLSISYIFFMNPNWNNPFEELSSKLPKNKFIEVLVCIAQEYDENRPIIKLSKDRRDKIENYLSERFPTVVQLILNMLQESLTLDSNLQEQIAVKVFSCFEAWFLFAKKDHLKVIESILITTFHYLKNNDCPSAVHEKASDALCQVIYQCEGHSTFADLRVHVMEQIFLLESAYHLAISAEDSDKLMNFAKIFSELGNSTIEYIIHDQVDMKILELILNCVAHYEFEVAEITFNFWYNFSELVYKYHSSKFVPYFNWLLSSLTRHCQLESDYQGIIDYRSDQYTYRIQINELIQDIIPCSDWADYIKSMNVMGTLNTPNTPWEIIEVHMYMFYCFTGDKKIFYLNEKKNIVIPEIVSYILSISSQQPELHMQVYATFCDILGELNEWINENSTFLQPVINFLLSLITSKYKTNLKLSSRACSALKLIVKSSETSVLDFNTIANLFSVLINIYSQIEDINGDLSVTLLACCTAIVSNPNVAKNDQQELFVQQLIQLCLTKINCLMSSKPFTNDHKKKWEKIIDNIYAVFKNFVPNDKTINSVTIHNSIRDSIWPFLKESITYFSSIDSQVIEHCSRCVRHIVRSMKPSYLLQPIVDHIVPLYQQFPANSSLLYIGSVLVDEFANKNDSIQCEGLIRMLNAFSLSTFQFLNETNINLHPYTIDDFFNLCTRTFINLTEKFLSNTETLNNILNLAIMSIYLDQKEANDSINKFITEFIKTDHPVIKSYINNNFGQKLIFSLVDAAMFKLPSYFVVDIADTLFTFITVDANLFKQYLHQTIEQLFQKIQNEGYQVTKENLENFYTSVTRASNPKRLVSELRYLQRLLN